LSVHGASEHVGSLDKSARVAMPKGIEDPGIPVLHLTL
jgi:hypothetical protein